MAADILIVSSDLVPVGKDQKQHLEVTRDVAASFHAVYGEEVFTLPKPLILDEVAVVPGVDGRKMSKSYDNTIEIYGPEKAIRKKIMGIVTDSTPVEEPKPTEDNALYSLLKLFAPDESETAWVEKAFAEGGVGYGDMKKKLFEYYLETFSEARARYEELRVRSCRGRAHSSRRCRKGARDHRPADGRGSPGGGDALAAVSGERFAIRRAGWKPAPQQKMVPELWCGLPARTGAVAVCSGWSRIQRQQPADRGRTDF